jgi:3D (Asp-Asp-Asp) domain-containing protein
MRLSQSVTRKVVATTITAVGFVVLYEATIFDSKYATRTVLEKERALEQLHQLEPNAVGAAMRFTASAYCKGTTTASGVIPRAGVAAADERLLPVGSVIQVQAIDQQYSGIYTVMDTGPMIQGRNIDLYMCSCFEALQFGRRIVQVAVLRLGWNPQTTSSSLFDTLFGWRQPPPTPAAPARPGR